MKRNDSGLFFNAAWNRCNAMNFYHISVFCGAGRIRYRHGKIIFHFMWAINWLVNSPPVPPTLGLTHLPLCFTFTTVLWTAQGHFLVENSEASTINRNTGMFWALLQCRYATSCNLWITECASGLINKSNRNIYTYISEVILCHCDKAMTGSWCWPNCIICIVCYKITAKNGHLVSNRNN